MTTESQENDGNDITSSTWKASIRTALAGLVTAALLVSAILIPILLLKRWT